MLAGLRAESDTGSLQDLILRTKQAPPPLASLDRTIPPALDAIVSRCLEPDPNQRFQRATDLAAALDALDEKGRAPAAAAAPQSAPAAASPRRRAPIAVAALA